MRVLSLEGTLLMLSEGTKNCRIKLLYRSTPHVFIERVSFWNKFMNNDLLVQSISAHVALEVVWNLNRYKN